MIYLDTHVAVWLASGETARLSRRAARLIDQEQLVISPIVLLEMQYLHELARVTDNPVLIVKELGKSIGLAIHSQDFERTILSASGQSWTRDPFDRIIVAHAHLASAPLLTKDESIRQHYRLALWD